jgi:hypothetical protein
MKTKHFSKLPRLAHIAILMAVCFCALSVEIKESRHHHHFLRLPRVQAGSCGTSSFSAGGVTWTCNAAFLSGGGTGGLSPQTITYSPTAGTTAVIWVYTCMDSSSCTANTAGQTIVVKDNVNNPETCFQASPGSPFAINDSGGFHEVGYLLVCPSLPAGITSFTASAQSPSNSFTAMWLADFSVSTGVPSSSTIDKDNLAVSSTSGTTGSVTLSATTTNANDLIIGLVDNDNDEAQTVGSGFGSIQCDNNTNGCLQAKAVSATGSYTVSATWTGADTWFAAAMGVKANAPSGAPHNQFPRVY